MFSISDIWNSSIELYDATGRLVHFQKIHQNETEIPVTHLNAGIYFYHLKGNNNMEHGKVVIAN